MVNQNMYSLFRVEEAFSTQDVAKSRYAEEPLLVVAERQTEGRGRQGTSWENAPLALAASLAFEPGWNPRDWGIIPLWAGLAAAETLGEEVKLKWPNDLLLEDRKIAGILVEADHPLVVVGWGLNLFWSNPPNGRGSFLREPPEEADRLRERLARGWAEHLLGGMSKPVKAWPRSDYEERCVTLGQEVTWQETQRGKATGIAPSGELIVETRTETKRLNAGRVSLTRT